MNSSMKINRKKRIITDLQRLREPPDPKLPTYDIRQEKGNDLNVIYTEIRGPAESFYEGGYFVIRFEFTPDYPVSSPSVAFQTKIWHPNVDHNSGSVCLNSLNQSWQPTVHLRHILDHHIPWLLQNGNADDPLNSDAGAAMKRKDVKYGQTVRQWVHRYASGSQLESHGAVWYRDERRKRRTKKKKKFSISALSGISTKSGGANGQNTPRTIKSNNESKHKKKEKNENGGNGGNRGNAKEENEDVVTPSKCRKPSAGGPGGGDGECSTVDLQPFQDWWTQSKLLPATPSQSGIKLLPNDTEPISPQNENDDVVVEDEDESSEHGDKLRNEPVCDETEDVEMAHNPRRKKRRRKMKKLQLEPAVDFLVGPNAPNDGDLSSMDEDPVCDLQSYQSLNSVNCFGDAMDSGTQHSLSPIHSSSFCPEFSALIMAASSRQMKVEEVERERADRILHVAPLHGKE